MALEYHHLDGIPLCNINDTIIPQMNKIEYTSLSAIFVLTSPQRLANNPEVLADLFECHRRQTLRLVTVNEAHLYAQHGGSFQKELKILTDTFFLVIFKEGDDIVISCYDRHHDSVALSVSKGTNNH